MCPAWSYGLSLPRWWSTQVITTWRKAPCQTRRLRRSGIFTVHYAATRSRCQSHIFPSNRARLGFATSTGGGHVLGELRAGGGVNGLGRREALEIPESIEGLDKFL